VQNVPEVDPGTEDRSAVPVVLNYQLYLKLMISVSTSSSRVSDILMVVCCIGLSFSNMVTVVVIVCERMNPYKVSSSLEGV